ncbi:hypothetical protein [Rhizorhabdus phycosphaerae]|nr:hypothetical protein [Rhizorhabdus phycosphaerae]
MLLGNDPQRFNGVIEVVDHDFFFWLVQKRSRKIDKPLGLRSALAG